MDREHEAVARFDLDLLAQAKALAVRRAGLPELAVDEDETFPPNLADGAADPFRIDADRPVAHLPRLSDGERPERPEPDRDPDDERLRRVVRRRRVVEEHDRADGE